MDVSPDTYELVGFDNSPIASEAILPITTIGQQIDVIAHTSMELLVQQMEERKRENQFRWQNQSINKLRLSLSAGRQQIKNIPLTSQHQTDHRFTKPSISTRMSMWTG